VSRQFRFLALAVACLVAVTCGPSPTPPPTSSPAAATSSPVQPSPNPNLVEFTTHLREATSREGQLVRALATASVASNDRLGLAARELAAWAADERTWLEDHEADTCYEDAWQAYRSAVDDIEAAAAALLTLASRPSPPTESEGQAAAAGLSTGGQALNAAADLANQARAACR
jgi:hypothetical protein